MHLDSIAPFLWRSSVKITSSPVNLQCAGPLISVNRADPDNWSHLSFMEFIGCWEILHPSSADFFFFQNYFFEC